MSADITKRLTAEMAEQCRIIGMSGERELALRATIAEQLRTIQALMVGLPDDGTTPVIRRIAALEAERDQLRAELELVEVGRDSFASVAGALDDALSRVKSERDALRARIAEAEGQTPEAEIVEYVDEDGDTY